MSVSVSVERKFSKLSQDTLIKAKNQFYRDVAATLPDVIRDNYAKGISPIGGKFLKYSQSYIDQIEGRLKFVTINGKPVPFKPKLLGVNAGATRGAVSSKNKGAVTGKDFISGKAYKQGAFSSISFRHEEFQKGMGVGKLKSPVNLRVTGKMWESLKARVEKEGVTVYIDRNEAPYAKYHNGEGMVDRHILPKGNESFSRLIMQKLKDKLNKAVTDQLTGPYG